MAEATLLQGKAQVGDQAKDSQEEGEEHAAATQQLTEDWLSNFDHALLEAEKRRQNLMKGSGCEEEEDALQHYADKEQEKEGPFNGLEYAPTKKDTFYLKVLPKNFLEKQLQKYKEALEVEKETSKLRLEEKLQLEEELIEAKLQLEDERRKVAALRSEKEALEDYVVVLADEMERETSQMMTMKEQFVEEFGDEAVYASGSSHSKGEGAAGGGYTGGGGGTCGGGDEGKRGGGEAGNEMPAAAAVRGRFRRRRNSSFLRSKLEEDGKEREVLIGLLQEHVMKVKEYGKEQQQELYEITAIVNNIAGEVDKLKDWQQEMMAGQRLMLQQQRQLLQLCFQQEDGRRELQCEEDDDYEMPRSSHQTVGGREGRSGTLLPKPIYRVGSSSYDTPYHYGLARVAAYASNSSQEEAERGNLVQNLNSLLFSSPSSSDLRRRSTLEFLERASKVEEATLPYFSPNRQATTFPATAGLLQGEHPPKSRSPGKSGAPSTALTSGKGKSLHSHIREAFAERRLSLLHNFRSEGSENCTEAGLRRSSSSCSSYSSSSFSSSSSSSSPSSSSSSSSSSSLSMNIADL
ncbi:hypothetical protein QOT17_017066 [Balamuthia mandrillaris]